MSVLAQRATATLAISASEYQKFCEYFYRRTGISFAENKRYFVDKRLLDRIQKTGASGVEDYFARLRRHDANDEIEILINLLTINETYFYREDHPTRSVWQMGFFPRWSPGVAKVMESGSGRCPARPAKSPIQLLSTFLKTGRRSMTTTSRSWPPISIRTSCAAAEGGIYDARSLHRLSPDLVRKYFVSAGAEGFKLIDAIRQSVRFTKVNASDVRRCVGSAASMSFSAATC